MENALDIVGEIDNARTIVAGRNLVSTITLKQRVAKRLKFTVTDSAGEVVDLSTATMSFVVKRTKEDAAYTIQVADGDMDKAEETSGIIYVPLSVANMTINAGSYIGELEILFDAADKDYSSDVDITVEKTVHHVVV